jgi:hypothetical protein
MTNPYSSTVYVLPVWRHGVAMIAVSAVTDYSGRTSLWRWRALAYDFKTFMENLSDKHKYLSRDFLVFKTYYNYIRWSMKQNTFFFLPISSRSTAPNWIYITHTRRNLLLFIRKPCNVLYMYTKNINRRANGLTVFSLIGPRVSIGYCFFFSYMSVLYSLTRLSPWNTLGGGHWIHTTSSIIHSKSLCVNNYWEGLRYLVSHDFLTRMLVHNAQRFLNVYKI